MYITYHNENKNFVLRGRSVLAYFHSEMAIRYPDKYKFTFDQLVDYVQLQVINQGDYIFGDETSPLHDLGKVIIEQKITDGRAGDAFKDLAKKTNGKLPPQNRMLSALLAALNDELSKFDFDTLGDISIEVVKSAVKTGNKIGSAVVDTTESLVTNAKWIIPGIILVLGAFYVMQVRKV